MSTGPISANGIAVTIPSGKQVFWTAVAQASFSQYVKVTTASGTLVFDQSGTSSDGHSPTQYGNGTFSTDAYSTTDYLVYIGVDGGTRWQSAIWDITTIGTASNTYLTNTVFISEDGSDNDYNDTCLTLSWFEYLG